MLEEFSPRLDIMNNNRYLFPVIRNRFLIIFFIFFFSLSSLNALASCFLESEASAKRTSEAPGSISCLDNLEKSFLYLAYQGQARSSLSKMEMRYPSAFPAGIIQSAPNHPALAQPLRNIFALFSVPIYQLNAVYRI